MPIAFGVGGGGSMVPFQLTIEPTGRVHASGFVQPRKHRLTHTEIASLSRLVREDFAAGLKSRQCVGTNPDVGVDFVRTHGRTVWVHGTCEPRFQQLWNTLARAVDFAAS
jgi:hypothetical protein